MSMNIHLAEEEMMTQMEVVKNQKRTEKEKKED